MLGTRGWEGGGCQEVLSVVNSPLIVTSEMGAKGKGLIRHPAPDTRNLAPSLSALAWYSLAVYTPSKGVITMAKTGVAKLFRNGRSQAVRLPREFRFEGDCVRVRRVSGGVLLQPFITDTAKWFEEMDRWAAEPFMASGRKQPKTPRREIFK